MHSGRRSERRRETRVAQGREEHVEKRKGFAPETGYKGTGGKMGREQEGGVLAAVRGRVVYFVKAEMFRCIGHASRWIGCS